jgi:monoterpene epsilon-lactone hydrolase
VCVELEIWPKMPHVFQMFAPFVPEANRALEQAAGFVRRVTAPRAVETS